MVEFYTINRRTQAFKFDTSSFSSPHSIDTPHVTSLVLFLSFPGMLPFKLLNIYEKFILKKVVGKLDLDRSRTYCFIVDRARTVGRFSASVYSTPKSLRRFVTTVLGLFDPCSINIRHTEEAV